MAFWIFMIVMVLLVPCVMAGAGRVFMKTAPKTINPVFGYRTTRSMKNTDTWTFAHEYIGKLWFYAGLILIPAVVVPMVLLIHRDAQTVGKIGAALTLFSVVVMILTIIPTEQALKAVFDEDGNRRFIPLETEGQTTEPTEAFAQSDEYDVNEDEAFLQASTEQEVLRKDSPVSDDEDDAFFAEDIVKDTVEAVLHKMDEPSDDVFDL